MRSEKQKEIDMQIEHWKQFVTINPELNKYQGKILFPKKLALAEERLKNLESPELKNHHDQ